MNCDDNSTKRGRLNESEACCGTCRFWCWEEHVHGRHMGACRRNPPVIVGSPVNEVEAQALTFFPETAAGCWCGEFQPSKAKEYLGV